MMSKLRTLAEDKPWQIDVGFFIIVIVVASLLGGGVRLCLLALGASLPIEVWDLFKSVSIALAIFAEPSKALKRDDLEMGIRMAGVKAVAFGAPIFVVSTFLQNAVPGGEGADHDPYVVYMSMILFVPLLFFVGGRPLRQMWREFYGKGA